ncbi:MAG: IS256 family transposase [Candidatus Meridianibacter frigidus]|nr:MAG: IS256 family transposase [Candidatus Eremiobacteraeota bacterium]
MKRKRKDRMESLNLTSEQRAAFAELLGKKDVDVLRSMLSLVYDAAIQAQFDDHIGAEPHERSERRRDQRNGARSRGLNTRAGSLDLEIPRARNSNFKPTVIEHFKRSERALISVIQEAFIGGISTRKMEDVLAAMGVERLLKSQISELCTELDGRAEEFRNRPLTEKYPYLWLDALYEKVRLDDHVVSNAVVIAYGVTASGYRDVIGIDIVDTESKESWTGLLRGLRKRGLGGTKLVISDAHEGLKAAIGTVMQGAAWQRCKVHFYRNVLAHVPQSRKLEFAAALKAVFSQVSFESAQRAIVDVRARFSESLVKAMAVFDAGIDDALAFLAFPLEHHRKISSNNPIEHLNKEIRRRTRSIGIFPSPESALRLITMILVEQSEDWMTERRYMSPESLELVLQS